MKNRIIYLLQRILGFNNYLFLFSIFIISKLRYDKNEKDFLKLFDLIEDDGLVLDIGANIGVMTYYFSKKLKSSKVFAFEPVHHNIKTIKKIIRFFKLKNVKLFEIALNDHDGKIEMIMPRINSALKQGLSHVRTDKEYIDEEGEIFKVEGKCLDNVEELVNTNDKITAIKIDVEGHELNVLRGAEKTIKKHKPIIYCELWPDDKRLLTINYIKSIGYLVKVFDGDQFIEFTDQSTQNFFFVASEKNDL